MTPGDVELSSRTIRLRGTAAWRLAARFAVSAIASVAILPAMTRAAGEARTLTFFNIHNNETTTILFKRDGQFVPGALEKFNYAFRDWRKNEPTKMDPALIDLLWEIHTELGSKEPIHIISGFRSRGTNEMLRASVGGQASESRHILGKAADVHFPDVPLKALRYSALIRERGGVGYYPTSAIPFVHLDTDRIRHWPRLPRYELALLFPSGQSQHQPADGGPISIEDVHVAKAQHKDLALQVAAFYDSRSGKRPPVALAGLEPSAPLQIPPLAQALAPAPASAGRGIQMASLQPPQLVEPPRLVDRPSRFAIPSAAEQAHLTDLVLRASAGPADQAKRPELRLVSAPQPAPRPQASLSRAAGAPAEPTVASLIENDGNRPAGTFAQAPDFDEDHPDELSYRPFPIAPLMTLTASADDPALAKLTHPDAARTLEMLDQAGSMPPMRLRPGLKVAEMMWAQQFQGEAVNLGALQDAAPPASPMTSRKVRTN